LIREADMADMRIDGRNIAIPNSAYTGLELQDSAGAERSAMPVLRRGDKDIPVEPNEPISLEHGDRVTFMTPMESA
jgi:hypothetical protein